MATLFLSDLHLSADTPEFNARFGAVLEQHAGRLDALYLLGDVFEAWLGDDDDTLFVRDMVARLAAFSRQTPLYVMRGNRDFLLGLRFARETGAVLLNDPTRVSLYGRDYLLSHGDALCTDDIAYQRYRAKIRQPWRQTLLRALPLRLRRGIASYLRQRSRHDKADKPMALMDVNPDDVARLLAEYPDTVLIHGHTHRPALHLYTLDGQPRERHVLPDWRPGHCGGLLLDQGGLHEIQF